MVRYPIGEQDFKSLRERDCVYIDKTRFIEKIYNSGSKYYFLARPRRFGKSLFLSTLQYFFEGRRHLFSGLYIDTCELDWRPYPVLRLDLNSDRYASPGLLDDVLDNYFNKWEDIYEVRNKQSVMSQRFRNIIEAAHKKTGRQVVILVDEYDKPLVGNIDDAEEFEHYRDALSSIYTNFKSCAAHIRLVFLTGVSRFSKLSIFSDLNNLRDISFTNEFADICGITQNELVSRLHDGITRLSHESGSTFDEALAVLKKNYDGYRFAEHGCDIYNPWSLLNCLESGKIDDYWIDTGLPTIIRKILRTSDVLLEDAFETYCTADRLKGLDLSNPDITALMYQTGYLTIKDYLSATKEYLLGIPNDEVKKGFFSYLLPCYVENKAVPPNKIVSDIIRGFILGKPEKAMISMQTYFASVNYKLKMDNENNFHNAFYLLTDLIGLNVSAEVSTSDGSIDLLIQTSGFIYLIELKYNRSAKEALRQIEENHYSRPFLTDSRKLYKIGVNFSSKTRCIEDWTIVSGSREE